MLLGLVFRGVAFEFRWRTVRWRPVWDWGFFLGSTVAAFTQGIALGALVQGIEVSGRAYGGGWWDWLTPFSLMTGVALTVGYALLGATWLVMKTEGGLQRQAVAMSTVAALGMLAMIGVVSLWTPFLNPAFMERWLSWPAVLYVAPVPLAVLGATAALLTGLRDRRDRRPFFSALTLFVLSYVGLGISLWPLIVPPRITIWQAAAPDNSLLFLLVGAAILLPVILGYTAYAYWVFRGKVRPGEGYH
jgi:cytochrome d ubiquinol oxidase subunit II